MVSSPSPLLQLELQSAGDNVNTWGTNANSVFSRLEEAIAGIASIALSNADVTLTDTQYVANQARNSVLKLTGTLLANVNVIVPSRTKPYIVSNETSGAYTVTVKTAAGTGVTVTQGKKAIVYCDGTNVVKILSTDDFAATSTTMAMNGAAINETRATAIASATTTDIGAAAGNLVHVTGTTTITGLGTVQAGAERTVIFDGALTLTYNATSLILPGNANISTAAGDRAIFRSEGSGNWICIDYVRAASAAAVLGLSQTWAAPQVAGTSALTSGAAADFTTGGNKKTVTVNGGTFTITNPSAATTGATYQINISYTTSNAVAWGTNFKGISGVTFTNTAGAVDKVLFEYNGSTFELVGYSLNAGA